MCFEEQRLTQCPELRDETLCSRLCGGERKRHAEIDEEIVVQVLLKLAINKYI